MAPSEPSPFGMRLRPVVDGGGGLPGKPGLTALAVRDRVAASTQNQALNALLFLYREILGVELPWLDGLVRAKRPQHLPTVLTREEVRTVRLLECCRLRIKDVDFATNQITIRDGKGSKDRVTMLPSAVKIDLARLS